MFGCGLRVIAPAAGANLLLAHFRTRLALSSGDKGGELDEVRQRERPLIWKCAIGQLDASLPRPADDVVARHTVTT
jgi:hypothetical protein